MNNTTILGRLADRMQKLGALVWKIPDIERTGMSSRRIEGARSVLSVFRRAPTNQEGWKEVADTLFTSFTGGRKEYWSDFEYAFWTWLKWVFDEENLPDDFRPEFPELEKPQWWQSDIDDI